MGTRDTRNQTDSPADEPDLQSRYFQDVQTLPLLSVAEVTALAQQIQHGQQACKRLRRAGLSAGDALLWGRQGQQGAVSYERPRLVAIATRYAARYRRYHVTLEHAIHQVAHKVLQLAEGVEQGERALQQLIEGNVRLVIPIARRYVQRYGPYGLTPLDAMQEGNIGLHRAAQGFKPARGTKFSTYAEYWIRGAIGAFITDESHGGVHIPEKRYERCRKVQKALAKLLLAGREQTVPAIVEEIERTATLTPQKVALLTSQEVDEALDDLVFLPQWVESEELPISDPAEPLEALLETQVDQALWKKALGCLTPMECIVVLQHALEEQPHAAIGAALGQEVEERGKHPPRAGNVRVRYHRAKAKLQVLVPLMYVLAEQPQPPRGLNVPSAAMAGYGPLAPSIQAIKAAWLRLQPWPLVQYILWRRCWWHESWEEISQQLGMKKTRPVEQAYRHAIKQLRRR